MDCEGGGVGVEFSAPMSIDPRRSGAALWVLWVAAGALGGGLAVLLAFAGLTAMVNGPDEFRVLAYFGTLAAIVALFQSLLLTFIAPRKKAALLWLPATVVGATVVYTLFQNLVFRVSLTGSFALLPGGTASVILWGAYATTYTLALGLVQGLVLAVITARKMAWAVWVGGNLIAVPVSMNFMHVYVGPLASGPYLVVSSAISHGAGAAVTGLALLVILRLGRRYRGPVAPSAAAALEGQG